MRSMFPLPRVDDCVEDDDLEHTSCVQVEKLPKVVFRLYHLFRPLIKFNQI